MLRTLKHFGRYSDRRKVIVAGVLGFVLTLGVMEGINVCSVSLTTLLLSLATVIGALLGIWSAGVLSSARVRRKLAEQNARLDGAINNMVQGLCMFAADNRLVVWNERYRSMYNIDPRRIWRGCTIRDLLDARIAAGTFPLDPAKYDADLRAALAQGEPFPDEIALPDGRIQADRRRRLGRHPRGHHRAQACPARSRADALVPPYDHRERAFADRCEER